mmetsp:Transcript_15495/g.13535  ORF Transcript_15495/g.13535 Transcript_15495/m.13535 type:complete len:117 (+) Transcript_15495:176-526(+)
MEVGLTFECQDIACRSKSMLRKCVFQDYDVNYEKFPVLDSQESGSGEETKENSTIKFGIDPTNLVKFLGMIPSDRQIFFEYPVEDNILKVTTKAEINGIQEEIYSIKESLKIPVLL